MDIFYNDGIYFILIGPVRLCIYYNLKYNVNDIVVNTKMLTVRMRLMTVEGRKFCGCSGSYLNKQVIQAYYSIRKCFLLS